MKEKLEKMNGAVLIVLAGFIFSLSGCLAGHSKKISEAAPSSIEKVIHIISVSPLPETAKENATRVEIAYQDTDTMAFEFFQEDKRPCEFHPGEANLIIEKGERSLILPNAICALSE
ncbi:hypothetical protein FAI41_06360 [Acetobacteraceae bacterium]|nr:hypothetical protein FAI41_06360 [Acetobacteraceae bacterium]